MEGDPATRASAGVDLIDTRHGSSGRYVDKGGLLMIHGVPRRRDGHTSRTLQRSIAAVCLFDVAAVAAASRPVGMTRVSSNYGADT